MKIILVNSIYYPDRRGGAEVVVERVAKAFLTAGHQVSLISCGRADKVEMVDGIKVYRLAPRNIFNFLDINSQPIWKRVFWHFIDIFNFSAAAKISEILSDERPDLILSHNLKGLGYWSVRNFTKYDWIHTLHDVQLSVPSGLIIKGKEKSLAVRNPYNWLYSRINKKIFSSAKKVVSPSQWLLDFYYESGFFKKAQTLVVPNPMIIDQPYKSKTDSRAYLFHGQIEEHKGVKILLEAFSIFAKEQPGVKLLVSGEGRLVSELQSSYANQPWVEFLGYNDHQSLSEKIFPRASYLIVPSQCYENSPGIIYAAYLNSTPVLAARIGGIAELVEDGVNGYVFKAGDVQGLLTALRLTVQEGSQYQQLNKAAYDSIKNYSIDRYLAEVLLFAKNGR